MSFAKNLANKRGGAHKCCMVMGADVSFPDRAISLALVNHKIDTLLSNGRIGQSGAGASPHA